MTVDPNSVTGVRQVAIPVTPGSGHNIEEHTFFVIATTLNGQGEPDWDDVDSLRVFGAAQDPAQNLNMYESTYEQSNENNGWGAGSWVPEVGNVPDWDNLFFADVAAESGMPPSSIYSEMLDLLDQTGPHDPDRPVVVDTGLTYSPEGTNSNTPIATVDSRIGLGWETLELRQGGSPQGDVWNQNGIARGGEYIADINDENGSAYYVSGTTGGNDNTDNAIFVASGNGGDTINVENGTALRVEVPDHSSNPMSGTNINYEGYNRSGVTFSRSGGDLVIKKNSTGEIISKIEDYFYTESQHRPTISLDDGEIDVPSSLDTQTWYWYLLDIVNELADDFLEWAGLDSPLVLDLDDSGTIDLISQANSNAYFDIDGDGFAEQTGWVDSADGLLARDIDGDGEITSVSELFGSDTTDGFTLLAQHDSNNDGVIDEQDAVWSELQIWQDANENGYTEAGELSTLENFNIVSIDLNATEVSQTNEGHTVSHTSTFTIDDGVNPPDSRPIHDIWFENDNANTVYMGDVELDPSVIGLPNLRSFGTLLELRDAASIDNTGSGSLLSLVKDLSYIGAGDGAGEFEITDVFDDTTDLFDDVKDIMFRWAGVDGIATDSRGPYIDDARKLEFLEEMFGTDYVQTVANSPDPGPFPSTRIEEGFHDAQQYVYGRLLSQTGANRLFEGDTFYDPYQDSFSGITGLNTDVLDSLETHAATMTNIEVYWQNIVRMIEYSVGTDNLPTTDQNALDTAITNSDASLDLQTVLDTLSFDAPDGTVYNGTTGDDTLNGGTGDDQLNADDGNDVLNGGTGNDELNGGDGDDDLDGEAGSDLLQGGRGDDQYFYDLGQGLDYIQEFGTGTGNDNDRIMLEAGIDSGDITLTRISNNALQVDIDNGVNTGTIIIQNQFNYTTGGHVEYIEFNDTSTLQLDNQAYTLTGSADADFLTGVEVGGLNTDTIHGGGGDDRIEGGDGDDTLYGDDGNDRIFGENNDDTIEGGAGDDRIYGGSGADDMDGGTGNDRIEGGAGDDIYRFEGGHDLYIETTGSDDVYVDAAWASTDAQYFRTNNMLRVYFDEDNYFDIQNFFGGASNQIEDIYYDGESVIDLTSVSYVTQGDDTNNTISDGSSDTVLYGAGGDDDISAGGGNDIVYGGSGDDDIVGGYGNDWMSGGTGDDDLHGGGGGDDTFYYESGHDIMEDINNSTTDVIVMAEGWTAEDISFARYWNGSHPVWTLSTNDVVVELNGGATNSIVIENQFTNSGHFETLQFADDTTIDLKDHIYTTYGTESAETITGIARSWGNNDTFYAYGGDDTLNGGNGHDTLYGGEGNDDINAGSGDDILVGGAGDDDLHGAGGTDTYIYDGGIDIIRETGSGTEDVVYIDIDTVTVNDISVVQDGTYNADLIIDSGVNELDLRSMNTGGNRVDWAEFADGFVIWLPTYRDWTWGTDSADVLTGDGNANEIIGKDGNDVISGGGDADTAHGGAGDDILYGGTGADVLHGGVGTDIVDGGAGDDTLHGGDGNDELTGGADDDTLYGGDGTDTYIYDSGLDTIYETGGDFDVLKITGGVTADDIEITATGTNDITIVVNSGTDEITLKDARLIDGHVSTIEFDDGSTMVVPGGDGWILGTTGADTLYGGYENNVIMADDGDDTVDAVGGSNSVYGGNGADDITGAYGADILYGEAGDDTLTGGSGDDLLDGGADDDELHGGEGDDLYVFSGGLDEIYETGDGQDTVRIATAGTTINDISINDTATDDATLVVNASTDEILLDNLRGAGTDDRVETIEFADEFSVEISDYGNWDWGTASADTKTGDANDNVIIGKGGDDDIDGLGGADSIHGGSGADTIDGGDGADNLHGGIGIDTINGDGGDDLIRGGDGADILDGGADADTIYGQADADDIDGGTGDDVLYGGAGNDDLEGEGDNDTLYGEDGNDTLDGGAGDDTLYGGDGDDDLTGGSGSDTFVYDGGLDEIYETSTDTDTLRLALPVTISDITIDDDGTYDAILTIEDGVDEVFLSNVRNTDSYVDQIEFNDGFVIDIPDYNNWDWGTTGDDTETGDGNANTIIGMAGDDVIDGAAGADVIHGGAGQDDIDGGDDADYIHGGSDADTIDGEGGADTLLGGDGDDTMDGGAANDTLDGQDGDDTLIGGAGDDDLDGGDGTDTVSYASAAAGVTVDLSAGEATDDGDSGSDTLTDIENITGSDYADDLTGDDEANAINAGSGNDTLAGGGGDDDLDGGAGTDTVDYSDAFSRVVVDLAAGEASRDGNGGEDTLANIENIIGSAKADYLAGDSAANDIDGGNGNDTLIGGAGNDNLDGEGGTDTVSYAAAAAGVTVNLSTGSATDGSSDTDTLTSIENITGSDYADTLTGDSGANVISGGAGVDNVDAGSGDDTLIGGAGNDDLDGEGGTDTVSYTAAAAGVTVNLSTGSATDGSGDTDTLTSIENIVASAYADTLTGDSGANVISGGAGDDAVDAGSGDDTLIGGAGDDDLDGEGGTDTVDYSSENSFVTVDLSTGSATDGSDGTDTLTAIENIAGSAYSDDLTGDSGVNDIDGGSGADTIHAGAGADTVDGEADGDVIYGEAGADTLNGDGGSDWISGGDDADTITGGDGADILLGNDGNDSLDGDGDDDYLDGGLGTDTLWGGLGADVFNFSNTSSVDTVKDFDTGEDDVLDISDILTAYDPMSHTLTDWVMIQDSGSDSTLSVDLDGTGGTYSMTQIALIEGVTGLTDEVALEASGNLLVA